MFGSKQTCSATWNNINKSRYKINIFFWSKFAIATKLKYPIYTMLFYFVYLLHFYCHNSILKKIKRWIIYISEYLYIYIYKLHDQCNLKCFFFTVNIHGVFWWYVIVTHQVIFFNQDMCIKYWLCSIIGFGYVQSIGFFLRLNRR